MPCPARLYHYMKRPGGLYNFIDGAPPQPSLCHHHLPFRRLFSPGHLFRWTYSSSSDMSQPPLSPTFQALFNTALQDYKDKTGSSLVDHPFAKQLQESDSVDSITTILEEQARIFRQFRDHGKLVNSLKRLVNVFCLPLFSTVLDEVIGLVVCHKRHSLVYLVADHHSTAIPTCEINICWHLYPTRRISPIL